MATVTWPPELHVLRAWEVPLTAPSLSAVGTRGAVYQVSLPLNGSAPEIRAALGTPGPSATAWLQSAQHSR